MIGKGQLFISILFTTLLLAGCSDESLTSKSNPESFSWNTPIALESDGFGSFELRLAADNSGNIMAAWIKIDLTRQDGEIYHLHASRYDVQSQTWSPAYPIENLPGRIDFIRGVHKLAALPDGRFVVLWDQVQSTTQRIYFNIWDPEIGDWVGAREVTTELGYLGSSQLAVSPDGRALAIWTKSLDSTSLASDLYGSWLDPHTGSWGKPFLLEDLPGSARPIFSEMIQAKFMQNGDVMVAWPHYDAPNHMVASNLYQTSIGSWKGVETLPTESSTFLSDIAQDSQGNLLLAWTDYQKIYTRIMPADSINWEAPTVHADIGTPASYPPGDRVSRPILFTAPDGKNYLVWQQTLNDIDQSYLQRWLPDDYNWQAPQETDLNPKWFASSFPESEQLLTGITIESDGLTRHLSRQSWSLSDNSVSEPIRFNESIGDVLSLDTINLPGGMAIAAWSQAPPVGGDGGDGIVATKFGPPVASHPTNVPAADDANLDVSWGPTSPLDSGQTFAENLHLTRDMSGNLHAFWKSYATTAKNRPTLQTSRMDSLSGVWSLPETLFDGGSYYDFDLILKSLPPDGLLAVWESGGLLYSSTYSPSSGWTISSELPMPMITYGWDLDVNEAGRLTVLWEEHNGTDYQLYSSHRDPSDGTWSPSVLMATGGGSLQRVVALPNGGAMAFWTQFGNLGPDEGLYVSRFDPDSATWSPSELITSETISRRSELTVLSDNNGVYLGWVSLQGNNYIPFVRRYDLNISSWQSPQELLSAPGDIWEMKFAKGMQDELIVGMNWNDGTQHSLMLREYNSSTDTWRPVQTFFESSERFFNFRLVTNESGWLTATWEQWDGIKSKVMTSTRTDVNSTWSTAARLSSSGHEAWSPDIALDSEGLSVAVWAEIDADLTTTAIHSAELIR